MRKIWTIMLVLACFTGLAQEGELPLEVKSAFDKKYQDTRIGDWWAVNQLYYLDFNYKGGSYIAVYDGQGTWLETAETISELEIPGDLNEYIRSTFPSGRICICEKAETPEMQKFLRVTLLDAGNVERVIRANLDGKNAVVQEPNTPTTE